MIIQLLEAGLCNRLRALHSAHILAVELGRRHFIHWPVDDALGADFEDLFEPCEHFTINSPIAKAVRWVRGSHKMAASAIRPSLLKMPFGTSLDDVNDLYFYTEYGGIRKPIGRELKRCGIIYIRTVHSFLYGKPINYLRPISTTENRINQIAGQFDISNAVGVHIRRGDHTRSIEESPLELFFEHMKRIRSQQNGISFYLATDCEETRDCLVKEFGSCVTFNDSAEFLKNTVEGARAAVVDLWCLSKCRGIIGSSGSSFSQMAGQIGGVPVKVITKNGV